MPTPDDSRQARRAGAAPRISDRPTALIAMVLAVLLACDFLSGHPDEPDPTIDLVPASVTLEPGQMATFTAVVTNYGGSVVFSVADPSIASITEQGDRTVTIRANAPGTVVLTARLSTEFNSATSTITVVPAAGGTLPTGIRNSPLAQPEGLQILAPGPSGSTAFGPWADRYVAAVSGATGWAALDLSSGDVLHQPLGLAGPFFGVAAASQDPPGASTTGAFVAFGGGGYAVQNVIDGSFTATQIGFGTTYDAFPAGGRKITNVIPFVQPGSGVHFVQYDASGDAYFGTTEVVSPPPTGELVSAYLHDGSGQNVTGGGPPILMLTRAVQSIVWLNRRDGSPSTNVLTLGLDARKLRCIEVAGGGALCAVTLFGANQVAVFTWDGAESVAFTTNVPAPGSPVDLDLRTLPGGNVAMVTTGFNSGSLVEAELTPAGALVGSEVGSVPAGCAGAGHAVYVEDAAGLKVVGTCYSSNQYFIAESRF